jgi:hypothetical protein
MNDKITIGGILTDGSYEKLLVRKLLQKELPLDWSKINFGTRRFECPIVQAAMALTLDYVRDPETERLQKAVRRSEDLGYKGKDELLNLVCSEDRVIANDKGLHKRIKYWLADIAVNDVGRDWEPAPVFVNVNVDWVKDIREDGEETPLTLAMAKAHAYALKTDPELHKWLVVDGGDGQSPNAAGLLKRAQDLYKLFGIILQNGKRTIVGSLRVAALIMLGLFAFNFGDDPVQSSTQCRTDDLIQLVSTQCRTDEPAQLVSTQCRTDDLVQLTSTQCRTNDLVQLT